MTSIVKLLEEAKKWIGYLEKASNSQLDDYILNAGNNNYTIFSVKYCEYFGENINVYQAQPWCAMYVSVVFANVFGAAKAEQMIYGHYAYCPYGVNNFKRNGAWHTTPKAGDIIFFANNGIASHTGIVTKVDENRVYTIEGNTSSTNGVISNGGCVASKSYSLGYSKILGYGRPNYDLVVINDIEEYTEVNDIVWELAHRNIISNSDLWVSKCNDDANIYWFCRKLCHYIRTKQSGEKADRMYTDADEIIWDLAHRGIISDKNLWCNYIQRDKDIYYLLQKGLHYCRTY